MIHALRFLTLATVLAACGDRRQPRPASAPAGSAGPIAASWASGSASGHAPSSPHASGSAAAAHGPDELDLAVQLALKGQVAEARRLLEKAAQGGKEEAKLTPSREPNRAMVGVAFSGAGDALSVISDKGDEYRFDLPSGALRVLAVPRPSGGSTDDAAQDDPPEITAVTQGADAHPLVLRDPLRSWQTPSLPMASLVGAVDRYRTQHPVSLDPLAGGKSTKLHRRPREPDLFPGTGCTDCRFFEMVLSPGGTLLAANYGISNDRELRVFRVPSGAEISFHGGYADSYAFDHADRRLASLERGSLVVRPTATLAAAGTTFKGAQGEPGSLTDLAWSPDDALLIAAGSGSLVVLDASTGAARCKATASAPIAVPRRGDWIGAILDGAPAIVASGDCSTVRAMASSSAQSPMRLAFSADSTRLALLDMDGTVTLFDTASGAVLGSLRVGWGAAVALSPNNRVELLGEASRAVRLLGCEVRGKQLPASVCVDRLTSPGQAAAMLAGKR